MIQRIVDCIFYLECLEHGGDAVNGTEFYNPFEYFRIVFPFLQVFPELDASLKDCDSLFTMFCGFRSWYGECDRYHYWNFGTFGCGFGECIDLFQVMRIGYSRVRCNNRYVPVFTTTMESRPFSCNWIFWKYSQLFPDPYRSNTECRFERLQNCLAKRRKLSQSNFCLELRDRCGLGPVNDDDEDENGR